MAKVIFEPGNTCYVSDEVDAGWSAAMNVILLEKVHNNESEPEHSMWKVEDFENDRVGLVQEGYLRLI